MTEHTYPGHRLIDETTRERIRLLMKYCFRRGLVVAPKTWHLHFARRGREITKSHFYTLAEEFNCAGVVGRPTGSGRRVRRWGRKAAIVLYVDHKPGTPFKVTASGGALNVTFR